MPRRFFVPVAAVALTLGAAALALARDATPSPAASPAACASPIAASPVAVASPTASPVATPAAGCEPAFEIDLVDLAFQPNDLTIPANMPVQLTLANKGLALHNFGIDALHINVDLVPGETRVITIAIPAGDYNYYCDIPGHAAAGMFGMLHAK